MSVPTQVFNPQLDKITEREVVYDFISRLTYGKDVVDPDNNQTILLPRQTLVKESIEKLIMQFPDRISKNIQNIHTNILVTDTGSVTYNISIPKYHGKSATILLAYSDRTGFDLTDCFVAGTSSDPNADLFVYSLDIPYTNRESIKYYYTFDAITS